MLDPVEVCQREFVELLLQLPDLSVFERTDGFVGGQVLVLSLPDVLLLTGVTEHLGSTLKEGRERLLQDLDEGLQILCNADQKVFVH